MLHLETIAVSLALPRSHGFVSQRHSGSVISGIAMNIETVSYGGWQNNLRISNSEVELLVSLDVGPRILSYKVLGGENVLKNFDEELGQAGEDAFVIRGGHRLWVAPEDEKITYHWDNLPVTYEVTDDGEVVIVSVQEEPIRIRKSLGIRITESGAGVTIRHTVTNQGGEPLELATWGLTVMAPGGIQIIPQPPMGSHPEDLLPNRKLVLWPYTDLTDPRWTIGRRFLLLAQRAESMPTKLGLSHSVGWVGYLRGEDLFLKEVQYDPSAVYPDGGCNFETFTNSEMIEIETLGRLTLLGAGESTSHEERWYLSSGLVPVELNSEDAIADWIGPHVAEAGFAR